MTVPTFKNKHLYEQAFTHRSYLNESAEQLESNERFEFLGDSILSFVVSSYIFKQFPHLEEGELTNIRSVLTNTNTLYETAKKLELGKYLRLSKGEEASHGRENKTILANTVEAVIGGLFLDQGITAAHDFIHETIIAQIDDIVSRQGLKDSKSLLQEKIQENHRVSPQYKIISEVGPDHAKMYTIGVYLNDKLLAEGSGHSKQEAEKTAAANALATFE